ncbi:glycosyltransferase 87 family protein [Streptomyces sp. NPDC001153]
MAAAVKPTPALFPVFLLVTGVTAHLRSRDATPWLRHARGAAVAFAAATLPAAAVLPYDSWRFWTDVVFRAGRVGHAEDAANQAVRGVLARVLHTPDPGDLWAASAAVLASLGLAAAVAGGVARAAGPGGVRLRGHRAADQSGVLDAPLGVVCATRTAAVGTRTQDGGTGHAAGLLLVRPVVGAARHRTARTAPGGPGIDAFGPLPGNRCAVPRAGPDIVAGPRRRCARGQAVTKE